MTMVPGALVPGWNERLVRSGGGSGTDGVVQARPPPSANSVAAVTRRRREAKRAARPATGRQPGDDGTRSTSADRARAAPVAAGAQARGNVGGEDADPGADGNLVGTSAHLCGVIRRDRSGAASSAGRSATCRGGAPPATGC